MYTLCFDKNICFGVTNTDGTANILRVYFGVNTMEVFTGILPYSSIDSMQFQLGVCIPSMENMICGLYIHQGDMTYIKFSRGKFQILQMLFFTSRNAPQFSLFPYMIQANLKEQLHVPFQQLYISLPFSQLQVLFGRLCAQLNPFSPFCGLTKGVWERMKIEGHSGIKRQNRGLGPDFLFFFIIINIL